MLSKHLREIILEESRLLRQLKAQVEELERCLQHLAGKV